MLPTILDTLKELFYQPLKTQKIILKEDTSNGLHLVMKLIWSKTLSMLFNSTAKKEDLTGNLQTKSTKTTSALLKQEDWSMKQALILAGLYPTELTFSVTVLEDTEDNKIGQQQPNTALSNNGQQPSTKHISLQKLKHIPQPTPSQHKDIVLTISLPLVPMNPIFLLQELVTTEYTTGTDIEHGLIDSIILIKNK